MQSQFTLSITTENEAFGTDDLSRGQETARILRTLADKLEQRGMDCFKLKDANGNTVGEASTYEGE